MRADEGLVVNRELVRVSKSSVHRLGSDSSREQLRMGPEVHTPPDRAARQGFSLSAVSPIISGPFCPVAGTLGP